MSLFAPILLIIDLLPALESGSSTLKTNNSSIEKIVNKYIKTDDKHVVFNPVFEIN